METIFFTGFSGVGKSMIARLLASRKDLPYLDVDKFIEKEENKTIDEIFKNNGEHYFRDRENYVLKNHIKTGMIVSLGGGAIIDTENRHIIKRAGKVIYLKAKADTIYENLKNDYIKRPLLKDNFSIVYINKLLSEREYMYEEIQNYTITVDNKSIDEIFKETLAYYNYINKVKCHIFIK